MGTWGAGLLGLPRPRVAGNGSHSRPVTVGIHWLPTTRLEQAGGPRASRRGGGLHKQLGLRGHRPDGLETRRWLQPGKHRARVWPTSEIVLNWEFSMGSICGPSTPTRRLCSQRAWSGTVMARAANGPSPSLEGALPSNRNRPAARAPSPSSLTH